MAGTYADLLAEIAGYLGRTDPADPIAEVLPTFVRQVEARMNRELRLKLMEREAWAHVHPLQRTMGLPDKRRQGDWDVFLEMRDLRLNGRLLKNLDYMALDRIPEEHEYGMPKAYSIHGRELVLIPTPDAPYTLHLTYYAEIPPLGEKQRTNDILLHCPDLYLFGSLLFSAGWARSSVPLELWASYYNAAAASLSKSDASGRFTANIGLAPIRSV